MIQSGNKTPFVIEMPAGLYENSFRKTKLILKLIEQRFHSILVEDLRDSFS